MNWIQRNKKWLIIAGIFLAVATTVFLIWFFNRRKNYGENKPENQDPVNYSKDDFFKSVLSGLNVPVSDTNVATLKEWQRHEGGTASFNPLNTTKVINKGETNFNTAGVKNYPDFVTGVEATIRTLKLNYYVAIVEALAKELPTWKGNSGIVTALNTWGTTNYANSLV